MAQARIFQDSWNLLFFGVTGIAVALTLNIRNNAWGPSVVAESPDRGRDEPFDGATGSAERQPGMARSGYCSWLAGTGRLRNVLHHANIKEIAKA
jgi:hypothetical protein